MEFYNFSLNKSVYDKIEQNHIFSHFSSARKFSFVNRHNRPKFSANLKQLYSYSLQRNVHYSILCDEISL